MVASTEGRLVRERMLDALRLLALPPGEQITALPSFVELPDELARLFDEAYRMVTADAPAWSPADDERAALQEIDTVLEEMSRPPRGELAWTPEALAGSAWTLRALHADERWALLRRRAHRALRMLGSRPGRPDLTGIGSGSGADGGGPAGPPDPG